jgi:hypothetical protein
MFQNIRCFLTDILSGDKIAGLWTYQIIKKNLLYRVIINVSNIVGGCVLYLGAPLRQLDL